MRADVRAEKSRALTAVRGVEHLLEDRIVRSYPPAVRRDTVYYAP
ncbi:hypothetical protein Pdca_68720 (plasmid) [Pseudonocardia autotrophica]|nr:hypothetical protein Pdca_68720 [Pseudonocardia autotrophica]